MQSKLLRCDDSWNMWVYAYATCECILAFLLLRLSKVNDLCFVWIYTHSIWFSVSNNLSRVSGLSTISTRSFAYTRAYIWHVSKSIPLASLFKRSIKSVMKTLNKVGERGQPCFTPQLWGSRDHYLILWHYRYFYNYSALILLKMLLLIPAFNNFIHSKSLGTESKAFLKSTKHA